MGDVSVPCRHVFPELGYVVLCCIFWVLCSNHDLCSEARDDAGRYRVFPFLVTVCGQSQEVFFRPICLLPIFFTNLRLVLRFCYGFDDLLSKS